MSTVKQTALVYRLSADNTKLKKDLARSKAQLNRFRNQSKGISNAIKSNFAGMFGVFAAGAVMRNIFNTIANFEKQIDKVAAISGAGETQVKKLKESAIDLGRASKFTATEIGQLQEELARLGFTSRQIIQSTDAIRKLATAADTELADAARTTAATINAFNLSAKEADEVANIMAESFSKSALDLEKFSVGMSNVGASANAAGYNVSQTTAMLGALNDAGVDSSKAGTDLRTIFIELAKSGMTLEQAYAEILGSQDKLSTAVSLFGKRAAGAALILAENQEKVKGLHGELSDANKELDTMVAIMEDNLIGDLDRLKSAWETYILSLEDGSGVGAGAIRTLLKATTDLLNGLSDWDKFTGGTDWDAWRKQQQLNKQAAIEFQRILDGVTFGDVALDTFEAADAVKELDKRLKAFSQHEAFEIIQEHAEEYRETLKAIIKDEEIRKQKLQQIYDANKKLLEQERARAIVDRPTLGGAGVDEATVGTFTISNEGFERSKQELIDKYGEINEFIKSQSMTLKQTMVETTSMAISGFAEGLATGGIEKALTNIALVFAEGISRIGDQLITYGVTMLAARKALNNPFTNPVVAIAAGVAAKLAAAKLKGAIQDQSQGIASGGSGGGSGRGFSNVTGQSIRVSGEFVIKGKDLVYVLGEQNRNFSRTQG